jgi:hypothetical protein
MQTDITAQAVRRHDRVARDMLGLRGGVGDHRRLPRPVAADRRRCGPVPCPLYAWQYVQPPVSVCFVDGQRRGAVANLFLRAVLFSAALRLFSVSIPTRSRLCPRRSMHHERVPAAADPRSCRGRPISASLVACGGVAGAALVAAAHGDARESAVSAGLSSLWQSILWIGVVYG